MLSTNKFKPTLTEEQRAAARTLYLQLKPFRDVNRFMPLSYIDAFLQVAMDEGKAVSDYAAKSGISATVMTRNLLDIGDLNRNREPGYGMVTQERDLMDLRRHNARVTPKGRTMMDHVHHVLQMFTRKG